MASPIRQDDATGKYIATEEIASEHFQKVIVCKTTTGAATSALTDTELRASDVKVSLDSEVVHSIVDSGAVAATLAAETTKVIGTVNISAGQTVTASGPLTDTQLRLTAVPVSLATAPVLVAGTAVIGAVKDGGANSYGTNTYTTSADMTTAADIAPDPTAGQKSVLHQAAISAAVALEFTLQIETTPAAERHSFFIPANGTVIFIPRYPIKLGTADKNWQGKASIAGNVRISTVTTSEA